MGVFSINIASQDSAQACVGQRTSKSSSNPSVTKEQIKTGTKEQASA